MRRRGTPRRCSVVAVAAVVIVASSSSVARAWAPVLPNGAEAARRSRHGNRDRHVPRLHPDVGRDNAEGAPTEGGGGGNDCEDPPAALDLTAFRRRRDRILLRDVRRRWQQPPNPLLEDPTHFVQALLVALRGGRDGRADGVKGWGGALCLLEASTAEWRDVLVSSVGARAGVTDRQVAPTLQAALERPGSQFAVLVAPLTSSAAAAGATTTMTTTAGKTLARQGEGTNRRADAAAMAADDDDDGNTGGCNDYCLHFPTDAIDYGDGSCWVECRLRSTRDDELLVVTGWSLRKRPADGAWLLDGLDWQDFRDEYRPGIGREEWERICG